MGFKLFVSLGIILSSVFGWANECLLNEALKDPLLSGNARFWQEYGELTKIGSRPDAEIKSLIEKYRGTPLDQQNSARASAPIEKGFDLSIHHKAEKEISKLPPKLKEKVDEFLGAALKPGGIKDLHDNPGRWHFEKIKHGQNEFTVRLNEGYRVLFELNGNDLKVLRVNKGQIHSL